MAITVNPQGTLSQLPQDNPLVAAATGAPIPQPTGSPQPAATAVTPAGTPNLVAAQTPQRPFTTTLGDLLMSKGQNPQSLAPITSPHVQKIGDAAKQTLQSNPAAASQPGGWAKALVGAATDAMSAGKAVLGGLGDTAAVGTVPAGGGALEGIGRTLAARNQRITAARQQQFENQQTVDKNKVMIAEANVRMAHEQRLVHNLDEAAKDESVKNGQTQWDAMQGQAQPAQELETNLTHDQIQRLIKTPDNPSGKYDIHDITAIPMGKQTVGEDSNGNPLTSLTYRIVRVPDMNLDPSNPEQKDALDFMNKYAPPGNDPDKTWQGETGGTVHLNGPQFNMIMQHAHDAAAADMARELNIARMGLAAKEVQKSKETVQFLNDPLVMNALARSSNNGDVMATYNALQQRSQTQGDPLYGKYPNLRNDFREWMGREEDKDGKPGQFIFDKMQEDYQKKIDDRVSILKQEQQKVEAAHGEDAAGLASIYEDKAKNEPDPTLKKQYQIWSDQLKNSAAKSLEYDAQKKQKEQDITNAVDEENMPVLVDAAIHYQLDPNKLFSMRKNTNAQFKAAMLQKDPTWSEATYKQRYQMQQDLASDKSNSMGGQVESLNRFGMHVASANRGIQGLRNSGYPIINTPLNKIKSGMVGFPEAQAFRIEAETAKDEFLNFIKNGHVPPTAQEERLAADINENRTPAELQETFRAMAGLVAARAKAMNGRYSTIMGGGSIPGLLQPDTESILRQFGVDTQAVYKPNELTSFSSPINGTPAQQKAVQNLPPAAKGTVNIQLPSGKYMNIPEANLKAATDGGAQVIK